ncbi:hypothetical protein PMS76_09600, partial [Bifidobacterium longum]|uniref:hypothetical protein n=1 Tax=Bifidobacterium longum TaxID=216816 RepID=UPI001E4C1A81
MHNAALTFDYRCHSDRYYRQSSSQQQAGNRHRSSAGGNRQHSRRRALITLAAKIREADHGYAIAINRINNRTWVVPEFLRTLVFARPRGDDQFADCTFSPSL